MWGSPATYSERFPGPGAEQTPVVRQVGQSRRAGRAVSRAGFEDEEARNAELLGDH